MTDNAEKRRAAAKKAMQGTVGAAIGALLGPVGAVAGAAGIPVASQALSEWRDRRRKEAAAREEAVLARAAHLAGVSENELIERLQKQPFGDERFLQTMRAAQAVGSDQRLIALAKSLASGAGAESVLDIQWEIAFVRTIEDVEIVDLVVLSCFAKTANELGLGSGDSEFDEPVSTLNLTQLQMIHDELGDVLDGILARLERSGLIARLTSGGGTFFGGGGQRIDTYELTSFGRAALERLELLGATVS